MCMRKNGCLHGLKDGASLPRSRFLDVTQRSPKSNFTFGGTLRDIQKTAARETRTVPTNSKVFLRGLLTMREKQILTSDIEIQKENWG